MNEVHFELLIGKRVRDVDGKVVGRIQTANAVRRDTFYFIDEFEVGVAAWLQVLGITRARTVIPWQQLDLSDPERPRLKCTKAELLALQKNR